MRSKRVHSTLLLLACWGPCTFAQDLLSQSDADVLDALVKILNTPVVSASKYLQAIGLAPAKVVVITAEDIRRRGYHGLDEIFQDLAGVDITQGRSVERTTLFMRGMRTENTDRFLLIWDGVIQNDPWKYNVWVSRQYPLLNIDQIEVVYGPGSLLYGANAFGGIINIILKKPEDIHGWSVLATGGSYDSRLVEVNAGTQRGPWRFSANARAFTSDEMDVNRESWVDNGGRKRFYNFVLERDGMGDPTDPSGYAPGLKVSNGVAHWSVNGQDQPFDGSSFGRTKDWFVQGGVGFEGWDLKAFYWSRSEIQDLWYTPLRTLQTPWTPTGSSISISHSKAFPSGLKMNSYVRTLHAGLDSEESYAGNFTRTINNNPADPNNLKVSNLNAVGYYKLFNREWRAGQQFNLGDPRGEMVLGWEYVRSVTAEDYSKRSLTSAPWSGSPHHDERNVAGFVSAQVSPNPMFSLTGGFRYDYNYLAGESGGFGHNYTVRLAGILSPSHKHRFKVMYGQAFQAPSPWAKFSIVRGARELQNPFLKPERLNSLELVYEYSPHRRWMHSVSSYYNQVSDLIVAVKTAFRSGTTEQHQNLGNLRIFGQELESRYFLDSKNSFYLNATFSSTKIPETGKAQLGLAPFKANAGVDLSWGQTWTLDLRGHYVSSRDTMSAPAADLYGAKRAGAAFTLDLTLLWAEALPGMEARFQIYNLLNRRYYDPGARSADGATYNALIIQELRRVYMGITYKF